MKKTILTLSAATLLLGSTPTTQAALCPEKLLPENTLAVLAVKDLQHDAEQFQKSPFGLHLKDPAMQPFMDYVKKAVANPVNEFIKLLEVKEINLKQYQELFQGGVSLALLPGARDTFNYFNDQSYVMLPPLLPLGFLLAETSGDAEQIKEFSEMLQSKLPQLVPNIQIETKNLNGTEIITFAFPSSEESYYNYAGTNKLGRNVSTQVWETITKKTEIYVGFKDHLFVASGNWGISEVERKIEVVPMDTGKPASPKDGKNVKEDSDEIDSNTLEQILEKNQLFEEQQKSFSIFQDAILQQMTQILDGQKDKTTLSTSPEFLAQGPFAEERDYFFLNFTPLTGFVKEMLLKADENYEAPKDTLEALMKPPRPSVIYDTLGIDAFKSLSCTWWTDPDGDSRSVTQLICPESERKGLSGVLNALVAGDCSPLPQTPANVMNFSRVYLDPIGIWTNLDLTATKILGAVKGMGVGAAQAFLMQDPAINLQKNLLENLTGEIVYWEPPIVKGEDGKFVNEQILLVGAKDSAVLLGELVSIYNLAVKGHDLPLEKTVIGGVDVYSITLMQKMSDSPSPLKTILEGFSEPQFNLAAVEGYLLYSTQKSGIEHFLSKTRETRLPGRKEIQVAAEKIGGFGQCTFAFCDYQSSMESIKIVWDKMVLPQMEESDLPEQLKTALSLLPEFEKIKKYFGFSVKTVQITPQGIKIQKCLPFPKAVNELKIEN